MYEISTSALNYFAKCSKLQYVTAGIKSIGQTGWNMRSPILLRQVKNQSHPWALLLLPIGSLICGWSNKDRRKQMSDSINIFKPFTNGPLKKNKTYPSGPIHWEIRRRNTQLQIPTLCVCNI